MFSIREFLRRREALLCHFSSPMRTCRSIIFPDDLTKAMELKEKVVCFSTILADDKGPSRVNESANEENAVGSVGIIVDIEDTGCVVAVDSHDCGSILDRDTGERTYCTNGPTEENCAASIDERKGYNEWLVKNYRVVGIFVFEPIYVWKKCKIGSVDDYTEARISIVEVLETFPSLKMISTHNSSFIEYDKRKMKWVSVSYSDILCPIEDAAANSREKSTVH